MKKIIASYKKPDGTWEPQKEVLMHPLEQEYMRTTWELHDKKELAGSSPSDSEEKEWLIEFGPDYVKQKRKEHKDKLDKAKPELDLLEAKIKECEDKWNAHCQACAAKGLDWDTHPGNAAEE